MTGIPYASLKSKTWTEADTARVRELLARRLECFLAHPIGCRCQH